MTLKFDGRPITSEVSPVSNIFTFNQEISLKPALGKDIEIRIYLATEKYGTIEAGLLRLDFANPLLTVKEKLILPLQKSADPNAVAEIKIQKINFQNQDKASYNLNHNVVMERNFRSPSHKILQNKPQIDIASETRSELRGENAYVKHVSFIENPHTKSRADPERLRRDMLGARSPGFNKELY